MGNDTLYGGAGIDTLSYKYSNNPVSVDLQNNMANYTSNSFDLKTIFGLF